MITEDRIVKNISLVISAIIIFMLIAGRFISDRTSQLRDIKVAQDESITIIEEIPEDLDTEYYQAYSTYVLGRKYSGLDICNIENYSELEDIAVYVIPHEETQGQFSVTFAYIFVGTNEDRTEWYFKQVQEDVYQTLGIYP